MVIHGDDFTALGTDEDLNWYMKMSMGMLFTKVKGRLGPGPNDGNPMRVLTRVVEWTETYNILGIPKTCRDNV